MDSKSGEEALARLKRLPVSSLRELVGHLTLRQAQSIRGQQPAKNELARLLLARYGPTLLAGRPGAGYRGSPRLELLKQLDDTELRALLSQLRGRSVRSRNRRRMLHELSTYPWVRGSRNSLLITGALGLPAVFAGQADDTPAPRSEVVPAAFEYHPLFRYQQQLVEELLKLLQTESRAMLSCYTGTGKTRMGMEILCRSLQNRRSATVIWAAHKAELLEQAIATLKRIWPHLTRGLSLRVMRYYGGNELDECELAEDQINVIFCSNQQVVLRLRAGDTNLIDWLGKTDLLVVDEAHMALAAGYQDLLADYESIRGETHRVLGLSATPGRSDLISPQESAALGQLFHGCLVIPDVNQGRSPLQWFQKHGYLSRIDHQRMHLPSRLTAKLREQIEQEEDLPLAVLERLGRDPRRNAHILKVAAQMVKKGRRPLIFCCSVQQAKLLQDLLLLEGLDAGAVTGEMDLRDRHWILEQYRKRKMQVLLNVEVLTTGFDIPHVDTLMLCRPTFSGILYEQMVGRGLRGPRVGGTERCLIVDFTENFERFERPLAWQRWWEAWPQSRLDFLARSAPEAWNTRPA
ncbi:MAG: DEAD/DEAH box helicase family protein [Candidatus Eremiobacteraeota bacterium]|nr:DEAD/DEAH box helicase family protein [Candidatus Eremiobacteraeota bacterium]